MMTWSQLSPKGGKERTATISLYLLLGHWFLLRDRQEQFAYCWDVLLKIQS